MARLINFSVEVTDEEFTNFLSRMSGADGRKVTALVEAADDETDTPNAAAPAVDKNNVAWNATYHSSSKALNADGTWRRRKGMTDAEKAAADAYDAAGTSVTEQPASRAEMVNEVGQVPAAAPSLAVAAPVAPTMPGMPGLPTAAPAPTPVTYEEVVALFGQAVAKDASVSANFAELYAKAGVTDPQALTTDAGAEQRIALAGLLRGIIG